MTTSDCCLLLPLAAPLRGVPGLPAARGGVNVHTSVAGAVHCTTAVQGPDRARFVAPAESCRAHDGRPPLHKKRPKVLSVPAACMWCWPWLHHRATPSSLWYMHRPSAAHAQPLCVAHTVVCGQTCKRRSATMQTQSCRVVLKPPCRKDLSRTCSCQPACLNKCLLGSCSMFSRGRVDAQSRKLARHVGRQADREIDINSIFACDEGMQCEMCCSGRARASELKCARVHDILI